MEFITDPLKEFTVYGRTFVVASGCLVIAGSGAEAHAKSGAKVTVDAGGIAYGYTGSSLVVKSGGAAVAYAGSFVTALQGSTVWLHPGAQYRSFGAQLYLAQS